jgi:hypothetical protein
MIAAFSLSLSLALSIAFDLTCTLEPYKSMDTNKKAI